MLAKKFRLRSFFIPRGKSIAIKTKHLLFYFTRTELPHSRFTVSVSKSVLKLAVRRNAIRRAVYEAIRRRNLHRRAGYDVVIRGLAGISKDTIGEDVEIFRQRSMINS